MIFSSTMKLWPRWWLYYCKNTIWYWMSDQSMEQHTSCHRFSVVSQMTDHARLRCIPSLSLLGEQVQNFQLQYDESVTQMVIWQWKKESIWSWMSDQAVEQHTSCHRFYVVVSRWLIMPYLGVSPHCPHLIIMDYSKSMTR